MVKQRPDIRAAEALLHQASANAGVATANQYPQILLSASVGGVGTSFLNGGDIWNVGSSLTQPIFNAAHCRQKSAKRWQLTMKQTESTVKRSSKPSVK